MAPFRILFVGEVHSTHAQSWMRLLDGEDFSIRCFQTTPLFLPYPGEFGFPTLMPLSQGTNDRPEMLKRPSAPVRAAIRIAAGLRPAIARSYAMRVLARLVRAWRPEIVHTFGLTPGGEFFHTTLTRHRLRPAIGRWVIQVRGGSDLALTHADPQRGPALAGIARDADAIISDNPLNFEYLAELGTRVAPDRQLIAPGTGGIDVDMLATAWRGPTSARRLILWPKAYESPWSKSLAVVEALKIAWREITPCRIEVLMTDEETKAWLCLWPQSMRESVSVSPHVARSRVLEHMTEARILLAPSLIDGTPNTMWEAMAAGAVPIVSPLPTLTPLVRDGEHVLFAHNLYPDEIARQLVRGMTDNGLVERIAANNLAFVRQHADRAAIKPQVREFYFRLLGGAAPPVRASTG